VPYSRHTIAAWDCTGYLAAVHLSVRSKAVGKLIAWIDGIRADPKLNCPQFCKILMLDKAGEWLKDTPKFAAQCKTRSIRVINPPEKLPK
jgi:hypothetical protein